VPHHTYSRSHSQSRIKPGVMCKAHQRCDRGDKGQSRAERSRVPVHGETKERYGGNSDRDNGETVMPMTRRIRRHAERNQRRGRADTGTDHQPQMDEGQPHTQRGQTTNHGGVSDRHTHAEGTDHQPQGKGQATNNNDTHSMRTIYTWIASTEHTIAHGNDRNRSRNTYHARSICIHDT
jgi:hypothetical protein